MRITCLLTLGLLATPGLGATIVVNDFWDDTTDPVGLTWSCEDFDHTNIQDAIDEALSGDTIIVCPGMYFPRATDDPEVDALMRSVFEETFLVIQGESDLLSGLPPVVMGNNEFPIVRQDIESSGLQISNLQLSFGAAPPVTINDKYVGGGVRCTAGMVTLQEVTIGGIVGLAPAGCYAADQGGGVYCGDNAIVAMTDCTISFNTALTNFGLDGEGGGVYFAELALGSIDGGTISGNVAARGGGISSHPDHFPDLDDHLTDQSKLTVCSNFATQHSANIWGSYMDGELICIAFDCGNVGVECDCPNAGMPNDCNAVQDVIEVTDRPHDDQDPYSDNEIQEAIDLLAGPTDIIRVNPGTYGPVDLQGKKVTIEALDPTPGETIIDGGGNLQCVKATSGETNVVAVRGFTIQNGYADGVRLLGLYLGHGGEGGGVYAYRSQPNIDMCMIRDNEAETRLPGGGGLFSDYEATITLTNSLMCQNTPRNMAGNVIDDGSNCASIVCDDGDGNGVPDECDSPGSDTWEVPSTLTPTIQDAINAAGTMDTIEIGAGEYLLDEPLMTHGKKLHLLAVDGPASTILDGQDASQVLLCENGETDDTVIDGFTITGGLGGNGGAVSLFGGNATFRDCRFKENRATTLGGAVNVAYYSSPTFDLCDFDGNRAAHAGGAVYVSSLSNPTFENTTFNNNIALFAGGAVTYENYNLNLGYNIWVYDIQLAQSAGSFTNCTFTQNEVANYGGAMFIAQEATPTFTDCTFQNNLADWDGGGIFVLNPNDNADGNDQAPTALPTVTGSEFGCNSPTDINEFVYWDLYHDGGDNEFETGVCALCPDVTGDGYVNTLDVIALVQAWSNVCVLCPEDINGDFTVDVNDLILLIEGWGMSCADL